MIDNFVLLIVTFIITLRIIEAYHSFSTSTTTRIAFALLILLANVFLGMVASLQRARIKNCFAYCISSVKPAKATFTKQ